MDNVIEWPQTNSLEEEAAAWIIMLDGDAPFTEHNRAALREWLSRSPEHVAMLKKLNTFWADNSLTELLEPTLASVAIKPKRRRGLVGFFAGWGVFGGTGETLSFSRGLSFASLVLVLGLVALFGPDLNRLGQTASNGPYATAVGEQKSVTLADGSVVELNTNSQMIVEYSKGYRNIHLVQGEMHFNVAKDATRPFRVYARNSRVQAVGTAFTVYLAAEDVEVYVTEGRVALAGLQALQTAPDGAMASNDQQAGEQAPMDDYVKSQVQDLGTLDIGGGVILTRSDAAKAAEAAQGTGQDAAQKRAQTLPLIATPQDKNLSQRLAWREGLLIFSGETLAQVLAEISRYTTVSIELASPDIRDIQIAGQVHVGDTDSMFKALESNFGLQVNRLAYN